MSRSFALASEEHDVSAVRANPTKHFIELDGRLASFVAKDGTWAGRGLRAPGRCHFRQRH